MISTVGKVGRVGMVSRPAIATLPAPTVSGTLIVFSGQSNMAGRPLSGGITQIVGKTTLPTTVPAGSANGYSTIYASTVSWAKIWNARDLDIGAAYDNPSIGNGKGQFVSATRYDDTGSAFVDFSAAEDPLNNTGDICWGPEISYLWHRYQRDTSKTLYVHKCAIGGTTLYDDGAPCWNAGVVGTPTRSIARTWVRRTNAALAAMKVDDPTLTAITVELVWAQGEGDVLNSAAPLAYAQNFADLMAYWRSALVAPSGTAVSLELASIARVNSPVGALTTTGRSALDVVKAGIMAAAAAEGAQVISMDGYTLQGDGIHYTNASYVQMGIDMEIAARNLASYTQATFAITNPSYTFMAERPVNAGIFIMKDPSNSPVLSGVPSYSASGLPPGCVINPAGIVLIETPALFVPGTYTPTIRRSNGDGTLGVNPVSPTITVVSENTNTLQDRIFVLDPSNAGTITSSGSSVSAITNADSVAPSGVGAFVQSATNFRPGLGAFPGKSKNGIVSDTTTGTGSTSLDCMTSPSIGTGASPSILTDNVLDAIVGVVVHPLSGGTSTGGVAGIINEASGGSALFSLGIYYDSTNQRFGVEWVNRSGAASRQTHSVTAAINTTHIVIARQIGANVFISVNGVEQSPTLNLGTVPRDAVLTSSETGGRLAIFGRNTAGNAARFAGWMGLCEWGVSASAAQYTNLAARLAAW